MGDLATVQQLAERVSQMGYPPLFRGRVRLDETFHDNLSNLEVQVLEEFLTACFDAHGWLIDGVGGYTEEDLEDIKAEAYRSGVVDGLSEAEQDLDKAYDRGYEDGYEAAKTAAWTDTRDED